MTALVAFVIVAPTAFALGWFARGFTERHRGHVVNAASKARLSRLFDWLADTRKLTVLAVITAVAVLSSIVYTWSADQQSEDRTDEVVRCIAQYVRATSQTQTPRTRASSEASDARRDWDAGYSEDAPTLTKAQLKDRYLRLYAKYVAVRDDNPALPTFSLRFCEGPQS